MQVFHGKNLNWEQYKFDNVRHLLGNRAPGFALMLEYLSTIQNPFIVETGCARQVDNFWGDGQSSFIFDYVANKQTGSFMTVDIAKESVDYCISRSSPRCEIILEDSITFLKTLNQEVNTKAIDLLYLDSFDAHEDVLEQSALHHLYEFITILPCLKKGAMVAVDDNWQTPNGWSGKGKYIFDYMMKINNPPIYSGWQFIWRV